MRAWKSRRQQQAAYSRLVTQVSEHDVVRVAEEVVGTAWMAVLAEAEDEADTTRRVCTHMRNTAYENYHRAEADPDAERLSESHRELADSEQLLDRVRDRYDSLHRFAEQERTAWIESERVRALEVLADQDRLAAADPGRESEDADPRNDD